MSHPNLLLRRKNSSSYHFRSYIPKDLKTHLGQSEFQISLKSSSFRTARGLVLRLYAVTQGLYEQLRSGEMKELTVSDIKEMLRIEVRKSVLHVHHVEEGNAHISESKILKNVSEISEQEENFNQRLQNDLKGVQKEVENDLEKILKSHGYEIKKFSVPFKRLRRWFIDLRKMRFQWKKDILLDRNKSEEEWDYEFWGQVEKTFKLGLEVPTKTIQSVQTTSLGSDDKDIIPLVNENQQKISELIEEYLIERSNLLDKGNIIEKTHDEYENSLKFFLEIVGDKRISQIGHSDGRQFRETLQKLPPNRNSNNLYKFKSVQEILDMNLPISKTMNARTINQNYIQKCSSWMKWCIDLGYYEGDNIFKGKTVKGESSVSVEEKQFSEEELNLIFTPKNFLEETINRGSHIRFPMYWVPLLGLYTGCLE